MSLQEPDLRHKAVEKIIYSAIILRFIQGNQFIPIPDNRSVEWKSRKNFWEIFVRIYFAELNQVIAP
ncbi:hypothetical protein [uncultured Duncaniella sp.]|uniref:hypothetical protein n=1 Tax=uncultured Duncaniella sp. TaxID=2768039 RepID=UPI0025B16D97|nr:hypothetical protein [uncultured Duncaniella sp.]